MRVAMLRSTALLFFALGAAESLRAADWPQWLGPSRNGTTSEVVAPWNEPPAVVWRRTVGNGYSSPIVADGVFIYHAAVAGKDAEEVQALDAKTGEPLWSDSYARNPYRSAFGAGPRTTPTAAGGKLYTYGITGILSCYDLKTGSRAWQTNPYEAFKVNLPRFGVCSSPVVVEGRVVVLVGGSESAVVAYDAATGEVAWQKFDEPASSASPVALIRGEGNERRAEVVVQTTLRTLGLSPRDGAVQWEHPLVFQPSGVSPTPLARGNSLVLTTQDTGTMSLELPEPGSTKLRSRWWKNDLASYFSTGTFGPKGTVLLVTNQQQPLPRADVRCLDLVTGDELWRRDGLGYYHAGLITTGDGKLLMLDDGGNLVLAEVTREDYKQLSKAQVCRGTLSNPALAGGCVYVRDDKEVVCLRLAAAQP
jgi:outer membrane protein assembly factor BamB